MENSHSYYDFQNIINTSNKLVSERIDLLEVYLKQVLKDNTEFRKRLKELNEELDKTTKYHNWYFDLPLYKIFWYKLLNKNINEIYVNIKKNGNI